MCKLVHAYSLRYIPASLDREIIYDTIKSYFINVNKYIVIVNEHFII